MTEHLTEQTIELYRRRAGDPTDRQKIATHLAVCDDCLKRILNSDTSVLAFNSLTEALLPPAGEEPFHLSQAELDQYANGATAEADKIICESHIDVCPQCNDQLRSISSRQTTAGSKSKSSSNEWFAWLRPGWESFTPTRVAVAIVLLGLVVAAIVVLKRQQSSVAPGEVARDGAQVTSVPLSSPGSINEPTTGPPDHPAGAEESTFILLKDNNRKIRLDHEGRLTGLEQLDEATQKSVKTALAGEGLSKPKALDDLSSPPIKLLGEPSKEIAFQLISPVGEVITEERPNFRWQPLSGGGSYVVSVFDENFNHVTQSSSLTRPSWTPISPLQRGQTYSWEVLAIKDGVKIRSTSSPAPRARFKVLEAEQLKALARLKQQKPASHLALGLMYARVGLVNEAEGEFRRLVKENPDSATAKKLLRTVQSWK